MIPRRATFPSGDPVVALKHFDRPSPLDPSRAEIDEFSWLLAGPITNINRLEEVKRRWPHIKIALVVTVGEFYWSGDWRKFEPWEIETCPLYNWTERVRANRRRYWDTVNRVTMRPSAYGRPLFMSWMERTARRSPGDGHPMEGWIKSLREVLSNPRVAAVVDHVHFDSGVTVNPGSYYSPEVSVGVRSKWAEVAFGLPQILGLRGYTVSANGWGPVPGWPKWNRLNIGWGAEDFRDDVGDGWHSRQPFVRYLESQRPMWDGELVASGWLNAQDATAPSFFRVRPSSSRSKGSRTYLLGSAVNTFFQGASPRSFLIADQLSPRFESFDLADHPVIHRRLVETKLTGRRGKREGDVYWRAGVLDGKRRWFGVDANSGRAVFRED